MNNTIKNLISINRLQNNIKELLIDQLNQKIQKI